MQTKHDYSFGVVPVYKNSDPAYLFCIVYRTAGYWEFPKGHREVGETEESAALREYSEEVGSEEITLLPGISYEEAYSFERDGVHFEKVSKYFIGLVEGMSTEVPSQGKDEIRDIAWLPFDEARDRLTYPGAKRIAEAVNKYLLSNLNI